MEKVKVSKELYETLVAALAMLPIENKEDSLLKRHAELLNEKGWKSNTFKPLNDLSLIQLAEILVNDFEIEETPEEKILKCYKQESLDAYGDGINSGIKLTLNTLGIKIKGINS